MTNALGTVVHQLRQSSLSTEEVTLTDAELLDRFIAWHDERAFAALVGRHGRMVLAVCRHILNNQADAEDAFQATFLVLVKKAGTIRPRGMVGNWLYGVAHTTALKARAMKNKRVYKERAAVCAPARADDPGSDDLHAFLARELHALPDRYRAVIVLCELEGKSHKEAARELGCPLGTIGTRLTRGRRLLARRLTARGIASVGATLGCLLAQHAGAAGVPPPVFHSTLRAAALLAAGQTAHGVISAEVAALTKGVLETMFFAKLKIATLLLLVVAALGTSLGGIGWTAATAGASTTVLAAAPVPQASGSAPAATAGKPAEAQAGIDDEPINHIWITEKRVQEELQLTEAQVQKITAIRLEANRKYAAERMEAEGEAKKLNFARTQAVSRKIQDAERKAFAEAAPQILSAGALKRLRQIQRQARGTHNLILEPVVRKKLKLDDEQAKQIESFLKEGQQAARKEFSKRAAGQSYGPIRMDDHIAQAQQAYAGAMQKAVGVLTPEQQRLWHDLVGEPFAFKAAASK
jgi:RNA polymerase sigma factor (sigma-70 family)